MNLKKYLFFCFSVIMSGDSAPPLQSSIPSPGYDLPDEVQPGKIISRESSLDESEKTNGNANSSPVTDDNIEQVSSDTTKTLSMLEEDNKIESNGIDHTDNGKLVDEPDDDSCLIQCIYVTQQCCECTIIWKKKNNCRYLVRILCHMYIFYINFYISIYICGLCNWTIFRNEILHLLAIFWFVIFIVNILWTKFSKLMKRKEKKKKLHKKISCCKRCQTAWDKETVVSN